MTSTLHVVLLSALFCMTGCNSSSEAQQQQSQEKESKAPEANAEFITIAQKATAIGPLHIGMTADQIESLQSSFTKKTTSVEGDDYTTYMLSISDQSVIEGMLNYEGEVYSITTTSNTIKDEFGNGIGSTLEDLQKSYPDGRLIRGMADGKFLNFLTATPLIFIMDKSLIPNRCFDIRENCEISESTEVIALKVTKYSPK